VRVGTNPLAGYRTSVAEQFLIFQSWRMKHVLCPGFEMAARRSQS
jgi:hypothetical protein